MAHHQYQQGLISEQRLRSAFAPVRGQVGGADAAIQVFDWLESQGALDASYVNFCRKEFETFERLVGMPTING